MGDPLLTVLTILLALLLFVIAPLHAAGIVISQDVGLAVALVVIVTVLFAYGISAAVVVMLLWRCLAATGAPPPTSNAPRSLPRRHRVDTLRPRFELGCRPCVFAPGRITYHRIMGAILLYLTIGVTFVALYTFLGCSFQIHFPACR